MGADAKPEMLELWGGVECTVNRVGDAYHDQLARSGHLLRLCDIDAFAELGLRALRVPVLWERVMPEGQEADFSSVDPMLQRVRERGLRAIAGLVHHGSGPRHTSLLEPSFELGLEGFAARVAERYPWLDHFTPVNEPLTTARFSALYGHWYPHARDTGSFLRALVHECRAVVRAMAAVRRVTPHAKLVQTEDIGSVLSSPKLRYQAEYENHRRWLSLDLLCGRVNREHPLHRHLLDHGVSPAELDWMVEHACPPDIVGINYYFTSDRYLDEELERWPPVEHGGNGRDRYADVCAVRVPEVGLVGHRGVIEAVWQRYQLPIALTEVHAGATREDQLRWLDEAYRASLDARASGIDLRALTVWALLGSFDWNSLVVRQTGHYEPGVFDLRGKEPRPTALAPMVHALAHGGRFDHPLLAATGWWRRLHTGAASRLALVHPTIDLRPARPLLITGRRGTLGQAFARACEARGIACELLDRNELDITQPGSIEQAVATLRPWAVINAAGYVRVDAAEQDAERCLAENSHGPALLAKACAERGVRLLTFSSDLVFDGNRSEPYLERDRVAPLSVYGRSKAEAERRVLDELPHALVVRTSAFFGPWDSANFVTLAIQALLQGRTFHAASDAVVSPTYVPHLVDACLDLLIDGATGLWHLSNDGAVSWAHFARRAAQLAGLPDELVVGCDLDALPLVAVRPRYSVLGSERARLMPSLEEGLARYLVEAEELRRAGRAA